MTANISRLLAIMIIFSALCMSVPASAQYDPEITQSEKAIFAYFKLTQGTPFFDPWIKGSSVYKKTPPARQEGFYEEELMRLKWGFGTFDEKEQFLEISADTYMQLNKTKDGPVLSFKFINSGSEEIPYFPYPYGDEWVALVINDLAYFTSVPLGPKQLETVATYFEPGKIYKGAVRMRIRPVSADATAPLLVDNGNFWLMMGDTAYFEFLYAPPESAQKLNIWSYTAPWYLSENEELLIDMLENRQ